MTRKLSGGRERKAFLYRLSGGHKRYAMISSFTEMPVTDRRFKGNLGERTLTRVTQVATEAASDSGSSS